VTGVSQLLVQLVIHKCDGMLRCSCCTAASSDEGISDLTN